mgnify:CR=1 FL=1|jgi:hypothetical protein
MFKDLMRMDDCSSFLGNLVMNKDYPVYKMRMFSTVDQFVDFRVLNYD